MLWLFFVSDSCLYFELIKITNDRFYIIAKFISSLSQRCRSSKQWCFMEPFRWGSRALKAALERDSARQSLWSYQNLTHYRNLWAWAQSHGPGPIKWCYAPLSILEIQAARVWVSALHATPNLQLPVAIAVFRNRHWTAEGRPALLHRACCFHCCENVAIFTYRKNCNTKTCTASVVLVTLIIILCQSLYFYDT